MTSPASGNGAGGWHEGPMSQWPPPLPGRWQPRPRLERNPEDAWLAGVASGIARHLGWPDGLVRAGFIILTLFNFLGLIVYRIGTHIPVPGINPDQLAHLFNQNQGTIVGLFNMFSGGALERMSVMALGVMPYISASIIVQLLSLIHL